MNSWGLRLAHTTRQRVLMAVIAAATGIEMLENGMFVFASSHIAGGVGAAPEEYAFVSTLYAVAGILVILKQRWLAARLGYRAFLTGALTLMAFGAWLCGMAHTSTQLAVARFVLGLGAGSLFTASRILINLCFAPELRLRALLFFTYGFFGGQISAPLLASYLVDHFVWSSVFFAVVPIALAGAIASWLVIPDFRERLRDEGEFEMRGIVFFAAGVLFVEVMMQRSRFDFFSDPLHLLELCLVGAICAMGYMWHQYSHHKPLIDFRVLVRNPAYVLGLGGYAVYYFFSYSTSYLFPIYMQQGLNWSVEHTGYLQAVASVTSLVVAVIYTLARPKFVQLKPFVLLGYLCLLGYAFLLSQSYQGVSSQWLILPMVLSGLGGVFAMIPIAELTFRGMDEYVFQHGYQTKNIVRQLVSSMSVSVMAVLMQDRQAVFMHQLTPSMTPLNPAYNAAVSQAQQAFGASVDATTAAHMASAWVGGLASQQALVLACVNVFFGFACLAALCAIFMAVQRRLR
ncbi:MFS transporter [Pandoraea cepalis]|uniref:MFS transporter n=1 Tax=Pandoraea cepalis TaxID=2508294 RepID=A0AAW7MSU3_9BURK|nr:MFS transporter [Pandoraea cepalis]MDN4575838.1 MFS transporter [Pandoraea cepalis]MDN4580940.1 MFS transporter [Pandoraea cepalis]